MMKTASNAINPIDFWENALSASLKDVNNAMASDEVKRERADNLRRDLAMLSQIREYYEGK